MDEQQKKAQLAQKLERFPLLRVLVFDRWFRLAFLTALLLGTAFTVLMLPVWDTAPEHLPRKNRIKLLDFIQAANLKRNAARYEAGGEWEEALAAWRTAMLNNRCDAEANRGILGTLLRRPDPQAQLTILGLVTANQLLQLTQTNAADVALAAAFDERYRLPELALQRLGPLRDEFTPEHRAVWARALLTTGRIEEFAREQRANKAAFDADPLLQLYRDAWLGGWGDAAAGVDARARLHAASTNAATAADALRLLLLVAAARQDPAQYEKSLAALDAAGAASLGQRTLYWRLLAATGRRDEARNLAKEYADTPELVSDVMRHAETLEALGLTTEALDFLNRHAARFTGAADLWIGYSALLLRHQKWDELRRIALLIRQVSSSQDPLTAYSHYLEARADLGRDRVTPARVSLDRLQDSAANLTPNLALAVAAGLTDVGRGELALRLLLPHEKELAYLPEYWSQRFRAAYALKDVAAMETASLRLLELQPRNPVWMNNRAAVLLILRRQPEEALSLTLQVMNAQPLAAAARINHALSLLLNQRADEAAGLLGTVPAARLSATEAAAYHLARTELHFQRREWSDAQRSSGLVDDAQLMPPQRAWLEDLREQIRGKLAGA